MTHDQLSRRIEITRERNRAAIKAADQRGTRLDRAALQSTRIVERAVRKLRAGA